MHYSLFTTYHPFTNYLWLTTYYLPATTYCLLIYLKASPMPPAPWLLACWVFAVWLCFSKCLCVCSRLISRSPFFKQLWLPKRLQSVLLKLLFGRTDASILGPWGAILAAWGHPGGRGSSRRDTLASGVGFLTILSWLRDPTLGAFQARWSKNCIFPCWFLACFLWLSGLHLVMVKLARQAFRFRRCAKTYSSQVSGFCGF